MPRDPSTGTHSPGTRPAQGRRLAGFTGLTKVSGLAQWRLRSLRKQGPCVHGEHGQPGKPGATKSARPGPQRPIVQREDVNVHFKYLLQLSRLAENRHFSFQHLQRSDFRMPVWPLSDFAAVGGAGAIRQACERPADAERSAAWMDGPGAGPRWAAHLSGPVAARCPWRQQGRLPQPPSRVPCSWVWGPGAPPCPPLLTVLLLSGTWEQRSCWVPSWK